MQTVSAQFEAPISQTASAKLHLPIVQTVSGLLVCSPNAAWIETELERTRPLLEGGFSSEPIANERKG